MEDDNLDQVCREYERLIEALDRAKVTVKEIGMLAEAFGGLSEGESFSVRILGHGLPTYEQTIMISK